MLCLFRPRLLWICEVVLRGPSEEPPFICCYIVLTLSQIFSRAGVLSLSFLKFGAAGLVCGWMKGNYLPSSEGTWTSPQLVAFWTFFVFFLSSEEEFVAFCHIYFLYWLFVCFAAVHNQLKVAMRLNAAQREVTQLIKSRSKTTPLSIKDISKPAGRWTDQEKKKKKKGKWFVFLSFFLSPSFVSPVWGSILPGRNNHYRSHTLRLPLPLLVRHTQGLALPSLALNPRLACVL